MFSIKRIDEIGWRIFKNDKPWGIFAYNTEWEAIEELYNAGYEEEALELQLLFEGKIL